MGLVTTLSVLLAIAALVVNATPYNSRFSRLDKVEAPYPPSGYRPQGEQLRLPSRTLQLQQQQNIRSGTVYGPPEVATEETTTETDVSTTELFTTTKDVEKNQLRQEELNHAQQKPKEHDEQQVQEKEEAGVYYIYHPDGLVQRIIYSTKFENMEYTARLTHKDVEPIKDSIYTYNPETLTFAQIQL